MNDEKPAVAARPQDEGQYQLAGYVHHDDIQALRINAARIRHIWGAPQPCSAVPVYERVAAAPQEAAPQGAMREQIDAYDNMLDWVGSASSGIVDLLRYPKEFQDGWADAMKQCYAAIKDAKAEAAASPAGQWVSEHERNVIVQAAAKALCSRAYPGRTLDEALSPNTSLWGRLLPEAELAVDAALKSLAMLRASPEPRKP